jgi:hypothetical protein
MACITNMGRSIAAGSEAPATRKANNLRIRNAAVAAADKLPFPRA